MNHLKSWLVETSADRKSWREVTREEGTDQLNGCYFTSTFPVSGCKDGRFIQLVQIGKNHLDNDAMFIEAWEMFGTLV